MAAAPAGRVPTIFRPCACQPSSQVSSVVATIAATGADFTITSAARGAMPSRASSGFSPVRAQNRNAAAPTPTAA